MNNPKIFVLFIKNLLFFCDKFNENFPDFLLLPRKVNNRQFFLFKYVYKASVTLNERYNSKS